MMPVTVMIVVAVKLAVTVNLTLQLTDLNAVIQQPMRLA
jgi:hypothetical protein